MRFYSVPIPTLLLIAVCAFIGHAGVAMAGTYDVGSCSTNPFAIPAPAPSGLDDAWVFDTDDTGHFQAVDACPPIYGTTDPDGHIAGLAARDRLASGAATRTRFMHWRFDAPAGTTLSRLRLWGSLGKRANTWVLYVRDAQGDVAPATDCVIDAGFWCEVGGPGGAVTDWSAQTTSLQVGAMCDDPGNCAAGATRNEVWAAIYSAVVTVDDPTAPTASGVTGSVLSPGYVHGTVSAGVTSASDNTGIRALQVRVDGSRVVARSSDRSGCDFSRRVPCPDLNAAETFSFDSAAIGDGVHTVQIGVLDSGQNFTAAGTQQITVDNTAPFAPTATSPTAVTTDAAATTIGWAEPAGQVAPITTARVTVCGPGGCQTATQPAGGGGSATVALPAFGTYSVAVALQDAAGNFSPGQAAGWTITRTATAGSGAPPAATPTPVTPPLPGIVRTSARLALARPMVARDRRTIAVRGTVAAGVTGRITVSAAARIGGRKRTITKRATIRSRRYAARIKLPSSAWRTATITVRFPGDARHLAARLARRVAQRHG